MTRQNYYKLRARRECLTIDEALVLSLVRRERGRQPRLGTRKLLCLVKPELRGAGVRLGRDRMFALLRRHDLLVPRPRRSARTTWSGHGFRVYPNLARDMELSRPHQLLVADITYLRTEEGFVYLCLVMDAFSRKIVGFDCSDSLEMRGALRAVGMALKQLPKGSETTHHSDRGVQYCCQSYCEALESAGARISMTEKNHCYENSQAERLNGILKQEYGLGATLASKAAARSAVSEAVVLYNEHRPHGALGHRMPEDVHQEAA